MELSRDATRSTIRIVLPKDKGQTTSLRDPDSLKRSSTRKDILAIEGGPKYRLRRKIAEGGMGVVYDAEDLHCQRRVALKMLPSAKKVNHDDRVQFVREARITARLEHPNIVPIHEVGRDIARHVYYTMKYVHGRSLTDILMDIRRGEQSIIEEYPLSRLLGIFLKVCDAIAFSHSRGYLHCDIKPDNIMVGEFGEVIVTDWGLARRFRKQPDEERGERFMQTATRFKTEHLLDTAATAGEGVEESVTKTSTGSIMGTPGFMAPERLLDDAAIDERSDIYSLGATLYSILTLRSPVTGNEITEVLRKILGGQITPPAAFNDPDQMKAMKLALRENQFPHCPGGRIPAPLSDIVMRALSTNPDERYPFVAEMQKDIEAYQNGQVWYLVVKDDFTDSQAFSSRWECAGGTWELGPGELRAYGGEPQLLIFKKDLPGDVRIEFECRQESAYLNDISCFIGASRLPNPREMPYTGYEFKFGGFDNSMNMLVRSDHRLWTEISSPIERGKTYRVMAERVGARLRLVVNQREIFNVVDPAPLSGGDHCVVGLFGWIADTRYRQVRIYYRGAAGWGDILDLADRQVQKGQYDMAVAMYNEVLETFADASRIERARQGIERAKHCRLIAAQTPDIQRQLEKAWPHTNVHVSMTGEGLVVDIADGEVEDLEPLRGLPIVTLYCQNNRIRSLEPLRGIRLGTLNCSGNPVEDLSPLADMPLRTLLCERCGVKSLDPLRNLPLSTLFVGGNPLDSLEPLRGKDLSSLNAWRAGIRDLGPLRGMRLSSLTVNANSISDLGPLSGMPLVMLNVAGNENIEDLSPLRGMRLKVLHIGRNRIASLQPLEGMKLGILTCTGNRITDLRSLKDMTLDVLTCGNNLLKHLVPFIYDPPEDFSFDCDTLSDAELKRALAAWRRRPETAHLALQVEVLLAIRTGERETLRRFARRWRDRYFLHVPKFVPWNQANALCREMGARLVEIPDTLTQGVLESMFTVGCWAWMGLECTETGLRWLSGQPISYLNFGDTAHKLLQGPKVFAKQWMSEHDSKAENTFIAEWVGV